MLKEERLKKIDEGGVVSGNGDVRKLTIGNLDEMSTLTMDEQTEIVEHGHEPKQWEIYLDIPNNTVYICGIGRTHNHANLRDKEKSLMAIKGRNVTETELVQFFNNLGVEVKLA